MPEGPDGKTIIIVKKVSGHGGHHGGAWKVAYADFITAMMALFMVLWLVNSAAEPTRQRIASYFRKPGVFQKGSGTPLETGGGGILPDTFAPPADENSQIQASEKIYDIDSSSGKVRDYFDPAQGEGDKSANELPKTASAAIEEKLVQEQASLEELAEQIEQVLTEASGQEAGLLGDVDVQVDQRGLLIEIMDTANASMFQLGSAEIVPEASKQLQKIAEVLSQLPNPVDVEGHTDSRPFRSSRRRQYDNWNLSIDRANSARRLLEGAGMKREQIARVVGYAYQRPKTPDEPLNPANRRITISMRFTEQAQAALQGRQASETRPQPIQLGGAPQPSTIEAPQPIAPLPSVQPEAPISATESPPTETKAEVKTEGLRVEIGTTLPEGTPLRQAEDPALRPPRIEKDKIFGGKNSFFE